MIEDIRNIQFFTKDQLSNKDYHAHEYVSGSQLVTLFNDCPAQLKFGEQKESAPLHFGIASHAALLEPEKFDAEFVCDIDKDDPDLIASDAQLKAWLKLRGVQHKSTAPFSDLVLLAIKTKEMPKILKLESMILESESAHTGKIIVKKTDYDIIMQMRRVIFADKAMVNMLEGATVEASILCEVLVDGEWIGVKIRPDIITKNCEVPDYKTTSSMNPEKFGRDAHDRGYWLKQAFVCDVLAAAYKRKFKAGLLAQGKNSPHIHQLYWMTADQIGIGREQYTYALTTYNKCNKNNSWPAYFDGATELPTPDYLSKRYDF